MRFTARLVYFFEENRAARTYVFFLKHERVHYFYFTSMEEKRICFFLLECTSATRNFGHNWADRWMCILHSCFQRWGNILHPQSGIGAYLASLLSLRRRGKGCKHIYALRWVMTFWLFNNTLELRRNLIAALLWAELILITDPRWWERNVVWFRRVVEILSFSLPAHCLLQRRL